MKKTQKRKPEKQKAKNPKNPLSNSSPKVIPAEAVPNREYKSSVFIMLFGNDKKALLSLYNAVSGKHYTEPELLEINTLENAIYMGIKNDVSFVVDNSCLSLYEHQSTFSPNLPLRMLLYLSDLYSAMTRNVNLYGTRKVQIPPPQFLVFYNGQREQPDRQVLCLSDLYTVKEEEHKLELRAMMLNVNKGHNPELMDACRTLAEYAEYTDRVRKYTAEMSLAEAVERAITECIGEGILTDFLKKNRAEVRKVSIYEYDQEEHIRMEREEAWEEGHDSGWKDGLAQGEEQLLIEQIRRKLEKGLGVPEIADVLEQPETRIRSLMEKAEKLAI